MKFTLEPFKVEMLHNPIFKLNPTKENQTIISKRILFCQFIHYYTNDPKIFTVGLEKKITLGDPQLEPLQM